MSKKEKLAFYGGQKVRVKSMPSRSAIGAKEVKAINDVIKFYMTNLRNKDLYQKKSNIKIIKKVNIVSGLNFYNDKSDECNEKMNVLF